MSHAISQPPTRSSCSTPFLKCSFFKLALSCFLPYFHSLFAGKLHKHKKKLLLLLQNVPQTSPFLKWLCFSLSVGTPRCTTYQVNQYYPIAFSYSPIQFYLFLYSCLSYTEIRKSSISLACSPYLDGCPPLWRDLIGNVVTQRIKSYGYIKMSVNQKHSPTGSRVEIYRWTLNLNCPLILERWCAQTWMETYWWAACGFSLSTEIYFEL